MSINKEKVPFKEGTKIYQTFIVLSDLKWHCSKHELLSTQPAKAIQIIRQNGFEIENKTVYCKNCKEKTVHRRMISLDLVKGRIFTRSKLPELLKKRIREYYQMNMIIKHHNPSASERPDGVNKSKKI